jgi:hypothetical protein
MATSNDAADLHCGLTRNSTTSVDANRFDRVLPLGFCQHRNPIRLDFDHYRYAERVCRRIVFESQQVDTTNRDPAQFDGRADAAQRPREGQAIGDTNSFGSFLGCLAVGLELKGRTGRARRSGERLIGRVEDNPAGDQGQ